MRPSPENPLPNCSRKFEGTKLIRSLDCWRSKFISSASRVSFFKTLTNVLVAGRYVALLHRHSSPEDGGDCEVTTMSRVAGRHHVLGVEHLLGQLRDCQSSVLLRASGGEWSKPGHEEVETGEGNHVDGELPQVG